jgi:hypothetical protein
MSHNANENGDSDASLLSEGVRADALTSITNMLEELGIDSDL